MIEVGDGSSFGAKLSIDSCGRAIPAGGSVRGRQPRSRRVSPAADPDVGTRACGPREPDALFSAQDGDAGAFGGDPAGSGEPDARAAGDDDGLTGAAHPDFTVHLKNGIRADVPACAEIITDEAPPVGRFYLKSPGSREATERTAKTWTSVNGSLQARLSNSGR
ncbi:hypothetical protein [Streptomyces sp. NPDC056672]|uniref:hypothetical protein n=1 Tax=Streptomyces sp. NPDC056672 TaxID=3345906 RepID=UPI00368D9C0A